MIWGEQRREETTPSFLPCCEGCCTAGGWWICFYTSLTAPHLSWPLNKMWLCFGVPAPIYSSPFVAGLWSHSRCNGLLSFQIAPQKLIISSISQLCLRQEFGAVWGHILYLLSWKCSSIFSDLNKWVPYNSSQGSCCTVLPRSFHP